ncbi:MAG: hypothetical protein ACYTGZ_00535 [Planctomycetota bacterium]|jgi:hypothetical protein
MVLNGYSGIAAFAALLRIGLGLFLLAAAVQSLRRREESESRYYLRFIVGATLLGVALAAWPLFYLVLQSYVGLWPGVMCIDGVTRIGTNSANAAAHLPGLIAFLEWSKPALLFVAGTWLVIHIALRGGTRPILVRGSIVALLLLGLLGVVDGAAEGAYLVIPKHEQALATGCCSVGSQDLAFAPVRASGASVVPPGMAGQTWMLLGVGTLVIVLVSATIRAMRESRASAPWLALSLLGAASLLPVGAVYLREVGAPLFLRLPYHSCAYCLVGSAPESLVAIALFVLAVFAVGWAAVARGLDRSEALIAAPLLRFARFGLLAALLMVGVRMVSA